MRGNVELVTNSSLKILTLRNSIVVYILVLREMLTLICHALGFILCVVLVVARLSTCGCGSLNHVPSDRNLTADVGEVCVCVCGGGGGNQNRTCPEVKGGKIILRLS